MLLAFNALPEPDILNEAAGPDPDTYRFEKFSTNGVLVAISREVHPSPKSYDEE
jgi:hypothetical protein